MSAKKNKYRMKFFLLFLLVGVYSFTTSEEVFSQVVVNETTLVSDSYTVVADGSVTITIVGADGGNGSNTTGGKGATVVATFNVNSGDIIRYVVGEAGLTNSGSSAGGGGSTGVYINDVLVMVAGAGGGGDNSNGALGLGGNSVINGDAGTGTGPGTAGTNGNGGGATTNTSAAGGGGGVFSAGGDGAAGGGARSDNTTSNTSQNLSIANGGAGNGSGSAGGRGFSGGGGAASNYSGAGAGYSGGGAAGANGGAGGGGSFVAGSAVSSNITAGGDGSGNESDGSISINFSNNPPTLQSATVNGSSLVLDYNENLDNSSIPDIGDFDTYINGNSANVTNISISQDKVTLTITPIVQNGDNVLISYTVGSNPIQDVQGTDASSFNNQTVTNNSPDTTPPGIPQNVEANAGAGGIIEVIFSDVNETGSGVATYSVKRSTAQGGPYVQVGTVTDNESATYTYQDNTTTDGITYYYVVSAIDAANNEGSNSVEVSATADSGLPQLQTANVNASLLSLNYNESLDNTSTPATTDFMVTVNGSNRSVTVVSVNSSLVTLTLNPEVEQNDVVVVSYNPGTNRIKDSAGNEAPAFSNQSVTNNTTAFNVTPPSEVTATAIVDADIEITFLDVGESGQVDSYSVKRSTSENGTYTQIGTVTDNESSSYTFTDNTSIDGTLYYYVVTAIDEDTNESIASSKVNATADGTDPAVESILSGENSILLDYDELLDLNS
ncbi:MAG: SwmB domain-containing protein, partial [Balneola sp.]